MMAVSTVLPVQEIQQNRPLEELEAERYRKELYEGRRLEKEREQEKNRLEKEREKKAYRESDRADIPYYMGVKVDLLA